MAQLLEGRGHGNALGKLVFQKLRVVHRLIVHNIELINECLSSM